jgi:hypothetical protein
VTFAPLLGSPPSGYTIKGAHTLRLHIVSHFIPFSRCRRLWGGIATSLPEGVAAKAVHKALAFAPPPSCSKVMYTAKAWHNAMGLAYLCSKTLNLMPATPAPRPSRVSLPNKIPVIDPRHSISPSKALLVWSMLHHVPLDLSVVQFPGPPQRQHYPVLVTPLPCKVLYILFPLLAIYDHLTHRQHK